MKRLLLIACLCATAAFAGPYDQPYSLLTTDRSPSTDTNVIPVIVNRVDGITALSKAPAVVEPGLHKVTLDVPPRMGFRTATQVTFDLDVKPCTRYHLAARLDSPTTQSWQAMVRSVEPIGECEARFGVTGAR